MYRIHKLGNTVLVADPELRQGGGIPNKRRPKNGDSLLSILSKDLFSEEFFGRGMSAPLDPPLHFHPDQH